MNDDLPPFVLDFNKTVEECSVFTFITRDAALQEEACKTLEKTLTEASAEKQKAISAGNENQANILLGCENLAAGMIAELKMWVLLKKGEPDKAWDELINAQGFYANAIRSHEGFAACEDRLQRLHAVEHLVFPPQIFLSSGMIVKSQICSICGEEYEDCGHVKQRPYMGELCTVGLIPSKVDHVSIVSNPANKHCRILNFSENGLKRNRMTWTTEPIEDKPVSDSDEDAVSVEAVISTIDAAKPDTKGEAVKEPVLPSLETPIY